MSKVSLFLIRLLDRILGLLILTFFIVVLFIVVFFINENNTIINNAGNNQYKIYKPSSDNKVSFEELQKINPDVIGWLTIYDTPVDYPVTHCDNNSKYVNTSPLGEFSLSGALFLDSRNNEHFTDALSIIYGHNMTGNVMFGDFYMYEDEDYFNSHLNGTLFFDGEYHEIKIFACLSTNRYDGAVYDTGLKDTDKWLQNVYDKSIHCKRDIPQNSKILMLSTCTTGDTNGRKILLATIGNIVSVPDEKMTTQRDNNTIALSGGHNNPENNIFQIVIYGIVLIALTIVDIIWSKARKDKLKNEKT